MARYTYAVSDLHGQFSALKEMLQKIDFKDEDEMYILGDVIDRGPESIECVQWIMEQDNVLTLLGNHELLFADQFLHETEGIYNTIEEARKRLAKSEIQKMADWMMNLPECKLIHVNHRCFYLNHTQAVNREYFKEELTDRLFPAPSVYQNYYERQTEKVISIHGHIPVMQMRLWNGQNVSSRIWKNRHSCIIDIDCGAGYPGQGGCLGCLRLNDFREFYVKNLK